ncbi:MAG: ABC transporter ATP-binding protein [Candidatus Izemoplasmataceae bacterium]
MLKTLSQSIREYKKESILSPVFVALEVLCEILLPLIMAVLIDRIIARDITDLLLQGSLLVLLSMLALYFGYLSGKYSAIAASGFAKNIRKDIFYNVQTLSFSNIDRYSKSGFVTRMTTDTTNVQNAYGMLIRIAIRVPFMLVFSIAMAFSINVTLSWIFLASLPILAVLLFFIFKTAIPIFRRVFGKYDTLNAYVQENIKGIRVVKTFVKEDFEKTRFKTRSEDIRDDFVKGERLVALNQPAFQFILYVVMASVSIVGAYLIVTTFGGFDASGDPVWGELSTGSLSSLIIYGMQILASLMMLAMIFVMLTIFSASAKRITDVLEEESDLKNPENPVYQVKDGRIDFEDVYFKYTPDAEAWVLEAIDLKIDAGDTIGIIGATGTGKSSLVNLVSRLYDVDRGALKVGGTDVRDYDLDTLRREVAVVLQSNVLFSGTIAENIRWGNENASDEEVIRVAKLASAHDFIMEFSEGYETFIEQGGSNVSGGQKQRLCIARALLKNPKVLILDDSTSAVDTKTEADIRRELKESLPSMTKLIISQRVSSVEDADQVIVLDSGRIVNKGTHEELLDESEIYQDIHSMQALQDGDFDAT